MRTKDPSLIAMLACIFFLGSACSKNLRDAPSGNSIPTMTGSSTASLTLTDNATLIAYKNSPHHPFVGFLVADGSNSTNDYNPADAPDSVDFLEFFAGRDPVRAHWRVAQAKGTRIIVCHFIADAYFDGSVKDPSTPPGMGQTGSTASSTYDHWARDMYAQHIQADSLDGIDLDIESGSFGGDVQFNNLQNVLTSVAKYFGPRSTSALTIMGKKPVFFYDTDGSISNDATAYTSDSSGIDYVNFQAYTNPGQGWGGRGTQDFPSVIRRYGANKLIYLVDGDIFNTTQSDQAATDLISYANYIVANNAVGVGAYRMSRDFGNTPPFAVTRHAIQIMNPAGGNNTVGVVMYQDINYGGAATGVITKGNYTLSQLVTHGFVNDWASSIKIPSGWTVTMYKDDNFSGTSWVLTANTPNFVNLTPNANDVVSSVKIQ